MFEGPLPTRERAFDREQPQPLSTHLKEGEGSKTRGKETRTHN
jgi:hypothetical protein